MEWWLVRFGTSMTALAHPVYAARADHESSDPLMATSLTFGLTGSRRDRVRTLYGGKSDAAGVVVFGTMVPSDERGVSIDRGAARPTIRLRYDGAAVTNLVSARERVRAILRAGGVEANVPGPFHDPRPGGSVHHCGSVRMHANRQYGVLDPWNRVYDAPNVVVADSSCFTAAAEKNPTLTAMALAARAADRLADDLRGG
jgi:choline dehydrogenase-like flavoprotein